MLPQSAERRCLMPMTDAERFGECLDDIGCCENEKAELMHCRCNDDIPGTIRLLRKRRQALLDAIHKEEKQISCLDYLVFKLNEQLEQQLDENKGK